MRARVAKKVLRKVNGYRYGPGAPGYRYATAVRALDRVARWCGRWKPGHEWEGARRLSFYYESSRSARR